MKFNERSSLATTQLSPGGVALVVGMSERVHVLCTGATIDLGLRCITAANTIEACTRMAGSRPRVVIVPTTLTIAERTTITRAAEWARAELVELREDATLVDIAHAIQRAIARTVPTSEIRVSGDADSDSDADIARLSLDSDDAEDEDEAEDDAGPPTQRYPTS